MSFYILHWIYTGLHMRNVGKESTLTVVIYLNNAGFTCQDAGHRRR